MDGRGKHILIYHTSRRLRFINDPRRGTADVVLSKLGQEVTVDDEQRRQLLKLKNGREPMFTEKKGGHDDGIGCE